MLAVLIAAAGYFIWRQQAQSIEQQADRTLTAVGQLKAKQITSWLGERRGDAAILRADPLVATAAADLLAGRRTAAASADLQTLLDAFRRTYSYVVVVMTTPGGRVLLRAPQAAPALLDEQTTALVAKATATGVVQSSDLHLDGAGRTRIDFVAPILSPQGGVPAIAAVTLSADPGSFLFPLVQTWPSPSRSGETLLVERRGGQVLYLNDLRFRKGTALKLAVPANAANLPAAMAVRGRRGVVQGLDYRGVPVLAALQHVPGTPWYLVAKEDTNDVLGPIRTQAWMTAAVALVLVALAGVGTLLFWRVRESQVSAEIRESEEKFRRFFELTADLVVIADIEGNFREVNSAWAKTLGYSKEELLGRPYLELVHPEDKERTEQVIAEKLKRGDTVLSFENRYLRKDGSSVWLDWTSQPQVAEGYTFAIARDITERRRADEVLRDSEAALRAILDATPFPIALVDARDDVIDYWSRSALTLFGHTAPTAAEWYEIAYPDPEYRQAVIHRWKPLLDKARRSGQALNTGEYRIACRDGSERICELYVTFLADRLVVTFNDITARKHAEEELRDSEERLRFLIDQTPTVNWTLDADLRFTLSRGAGLQTLGLGPDKVLGMYVGDFLGGSGPQAELGVAMHRRALAGESFAYEQPIGDLVFDIILGPLRDADDALIGVIGVAYDATARKQADEARRAAERKVTKLNAELEQRVLDRTAQLDAANKELEAFAYSVSHDLRAPLRHISGFSALLAERLGDSLDERSRHYVDTISRSVRDMGVLIDDLLLFSRTGRAELRIASVDMDEVLREALEPLKLETSEREIEWAIGPLPRVVGDQALLRQVWANLLGNAVKYTRGRAPAYIEVGARHAGGADKDIFWVRDNGVGFDMQYAHKLFGVFQRLHDSSEFEGTGIGLANVQRIINRLGGRVWAEGEVDHGATFSFSLPRRKETPS